MASIEDEDYFPRGGKQIDDVSIPRGGKKIAVVSKVTQSAIFVKNAGLADPKVQPASKAMMSSELKPGLLGIGVVVSICPLEVILETSHGALVSLPANKVSETFSAQASSGEVTLDDVFSIGQLVPFKVDEKKSESSPKPVVTSFPAAINKHITIETLRPGLVLAASISAVSENHADVDIGMGGSLASMKVHAGTTFVVGQTLLVLYKGTKENVMKVSYRTEGGDLIIDNSQPMDLNCLTPGSVIKTTVHSSSFAGLHVQFGKDRTAFVYNRHLPTDFTYDENKSQSIRVIVLFCEPNTNTLVLSAHPHMINFHDSTLRTNFPGISATKQYKVTVTSVSPPIVNFSLTTEAEVEDELGVRTVKETFRAMAHKSQLKMDKLVSDYAEGTTHTVRVVSVSPIDRSMYVSDKDSVLSMKGRAGELLMGTVKAITGHRVYVNIARGYSGFIDSHHHLYDTKLTDLNGSKPVFSVGDTVKCRALCDMDLLIHSYSPLPLTCRPSLLKLETVVEKVAPDFVGKKTTGLVMQFMNQKGKSRGAIVSFFNNCTGFLPQKEVERLHSLRRFAAVDVELVGYDEGKYALKCLQTENCSTSVDAAETVLNLKETGLNKLHSFVYCEDHALKKQRNWAKNYKCPSPGALVDVTVEQIVDDVIFVVFEGKKTSKKVYGKLVDVQDGKTLVVNSRAMACVAGYDFETRRADLTLLKPGLAKEIDRQGTVIFSKSGYIVVRSISGSIFFLSAQGMTVQTGQPVDLLLTEKKKWRLNGKVQTTKQTPEHEQNSVEAERKETYDLVARKEYEGEVLGLWQHQQGSNHGSVAVELLLSNGTKARLHAASLGSQYRSVTDFIKKNSGKKITVIFTKMQKGQFADVVLPATQSPVNNNTKLEAGAQVTVVAKSATSSSVLFEINTSVDGTAERSSLPAAWNVSQAIERGEIHTATVLSMKNAHTAEIKVTSLTEKNANQTKKANSRKRKSKPKTRNGDNKKAKVEKLD